MSLIVRQVVSGSYPSPVRSGSVFRSFSLIAGCLYVASLSAQFLVYIIFNADFRKTFRRTFCYACNTEDSYYEAPQLLRRCCCCCGDQRQSWIDDSKSCSAQNDKVTAIPQDQLLWV